LVLCIFCICSHGLIQLTFIRRGKDGKPAGSITIRAQEIKDNKFIYKLSLSATDLDKKDFFGKSGELNCVLGSLEAHGVLTLFRP
jgi:hypothetical protein